VLVNNREVVNATISERRIGPGLSKNLRLWPPDLHLLPRQAGRAASWWL